MPVRTGIGKKNQPLVDSLKSRRQVATLGLLPSRVVAGLCRWRLFLATKQ